ncbi:hypothetical protein EDC04DRAFT_2698715, partial [Pisolithus marmoratus]
MGAPIESIYFSLCSLHLTILVPCVLYHSAQLFTVGALPLLLPQCCSHDILTTDMSTLSQTWTLDLLDETFQTILLYCCCCCHSGDIAFFVD